MHAHAQSYVMRLGGPEGFGVKLNAEAHARRWASVPQSAVLGDGATWIWNLAANDYATAAHVVDWHHAKQHLCAAADLICPQQPDLAATWVEQQAELLYAGRACEIADHIVLLAALANPDVKAKLQTEAGYFAANHEHERMQYRDFSRRVYPSAAALSSPPPNKPSIASPPLACAGRVRASTTSSPCARPS